MNYKSKAVQSIEWIFVTWWLGEYMTLNRMFYKLFSKHAVVAASVTEFLISFFKVASLGN